jgi:hypothetical protein
MQDEALAPTCLDRVDGALISASKAKEAIQPEGPKIFRLDVHPDDVALMVRYRAVRGEDTQIRVWAGTGSIGKVGAPEGYVLDSIDVIGTRWDGYGNGGMHRVVCLLGRTPDEKSALRYLVVVDQGDAIAIPPVDPTTLRGLNDFSLVYSDGGVLQPP